MKTHSPVKRRKKFQMKRVTVLLKLDNWVTSAHLNRCIFRALPSLPNKCVCFFWASVSFLKTLCPYRTRNTGGLWLSLTLNISLSRNIPSVQNSAKVKHTTRVGSFASVAVKQNIVQKFTAKTLGTRSWWAPKHRTEKEGFWSMVGVW